MNHSVLMAQGAGKTNTTIEWEPVKGAGGYQIELVRGGTVIVDQKTQLTYYRIDPTLLEPGTYKLRVSTLDRNQEVASNSPWITIQVKEKGATGERRIYVGIGWSYNILLQQWSQVAGNSAMSIHLYLGYDVFAPFGADLTFDYTLFNRQSGQSIVLESLAAMSLVPGLYYTRPINDKLSLYTRFGAGLTYGTMTIDEEGSKKQYHSTDPVVIPAVGVRGFYNENIFADAGVEFETIFYTSSPLFDIRPFLRVGMKF